MDGIEVRKENTLMKIKLTATNSTEQQVLDYLQNNASEVLAEKINVGKKTLAGSLSYAKGEAQKMAQGASCICVDDATVFGWIIHFFEEDEITEKAKSPAVKLPSGVKPPPAKYVVPAKKPPQGKPEPQLSMFEALLGGVK